MRRTEALIERRDFHHLTAGTMMEREVVVCHPTDTVRMIALRLTVDELGSLPVVDERGRLLGLVSEWDLLRAIREGLDLNVITAHEIMTPDPKTVSIDASFSEVARLLRDEHLIRVPVTQGDELAGILSRRDLLYGYLQATSP